MDVFRGFSLLHSVKSTKIIYAYYARNTNNACHGMQKCVHWWQVRSFRGCAGEIWKKRHGKRKKKENAVSGMFAMTTVALLVTVFLG